jgi:hypothetical protein
MFALFDRSQGLTGMYIGRRANPDSLQSWVLEHGIIGVVDGDPIICIVLPRPSGLVWLVTADCNDVGTGYPHEQGMNVTLAHTTEADDGHVEALDHDSGAERTSEDHESSLRGSLTEGALKMRKNL